MNCSIILLFLLFCGRNGCGCGRDTGCGCEEPKPVPPPCRPRERECGRERDCGRDREPERDCSCGNDSRFEPRFEPRPFSDTGCGCNDK